MVGERLALLSSPDAQKEALEEAFGEDILEVVAEQAEEELKLIDKLQGWKPWEPPAENVPEEQWAQGPSN